MFLPSDLLIRPAEVRDHRDVHRMISGIQRDEQQAELKEQIKKMFIHPAIWVFSGVVICVIGISLE